MIYLLYQSKYLNGIIDSIVIESLDFQCQYLAIKWTTWDFER